MKKLILGLCLVFGMVAFSAPGFVDVKKIKRKNYNIILDEDVALTYLGQSHVKIFFFKINNLI